MVDTSETRSPPKLGLEFRKEMVVNLRGKLEQAFKDAGWEELFDENEASGAYSLFCEDDQINDLANKTLRSFMLEQCSSEEDKALKSFLEAETHAFLNAALERNQKHREQCIRFMNEVLETFSSNYQRKLNTFSKITSSSSNIDNESNLQSFHEETTLKLFDEYDDAEKRGNAEFQNSYREQILERFERMFFGALTDRRKLAEEKRSQIQDTIAKHCENYSKLLNEEAMKIQSTTELGQMHQTLSAATLQKFKTELSFLGTTQYNLAELKLTESLYHAYQKILGELSATIKKNKRICKEEVEAGIVKYKSEMMKTIDSKRVSADHTILSVEHQRVFQSVLSDFDSRLTNEEDRFFTEDLKSRFKQRLEMKLLNKFATYEKKWEVNGHMVQLPLEVQEYFSSSGRILRESLKKNIFTTSKLEDIDWRCKNKVAAAKVRFHQRYPNLSEKYREQYWKQFVSRIYEKTAISLNQKLCQDELDAGVGKYKSEMMMAIKTMPVSTDQSDLSEEHQRVLKSVLSDFDSRLPKVDRYFTEDLKSTFKQRLEAKLLNKLAVFEKEWEANRHMVQLEIEEYFSSSGRILKETLKKNICTTSNLNDIESFCKTEVAAAKDRFHQWFPNLSEKYRDQQWKQFVSRIYEKTKTRINQKLCQDELQAGVGKYKLEMRMVVKTKPISTDQSDLSEEHQRVLKSVLSDFDSRLPKVDSYFTEDLKSTFKQRLEAKLLNKLAVFEKEWETNCRTVKLEVQEHLASSCCILQQALRNNTFSASKLNDLESFYRNEVAATKEGFHQRFPTLSKNYRQQQLVARLYENTESFIIDMMETRYVTQMRQFVSQKPYTHGELLQVLHKSILNSLLSQSNDTALHQQLMVKIENAYKNIQKEQEVKVSKLSEAAALSEKLLVSHATEIFKRFCDGVTVEEIEVFRQDDSQQILQQYTQTLSWAESTNAYSNLLRELEIGLNTSFDKAKLAIEQLEMFYNEYYRQKDLSSENVTIPPEVCQNFHDKACSSAISKCINENLLADEKVFTQESKRFLNKKHQEKLADAFVIGIDFGQEICKSAVYVNGKSQMIPHYDESWEEFSSMSSYVGVGDCDGLVGQHAKSSVEKFSEFCQIIWDLKLHYFQNIDYTLWVREWCAWKIGQNPGTISIDGTNYLIATVVSKLFKKLKANAEKFLNHSVNKCVLTMDFRFYNIDKSRCDIVKAVKLAGFEEVEFLEKCDSAVLLFKHIVNLQILKRKIAFIDFGNVFNFYALEVSETNCIMLATKYCYGGSWLLRELIEYCIKSFCTLENVNRHALDSDATFNYQKRRIHIACEKAIKALSLTETVKVNISCFYEGKELCAEITRAMMEEIFNPKVTIFLENVHSDISFFKLSLENIDEIIIYGGFSRMPLIQKTLTSFFNERPLNNLNVDPDEVEARGAAIKGAQLAANLIRTGKFKTN